MELFYYKNKEGNFGDDLNPYIWPKLLPQFHATKNETLFAGIGTILTTRFIEQHSRRNVIVFGSGARGYYQQRQLPANYQVVFVRGPLTALVFGLSPTIAITDPAYALRLLPSNTLAPPLSPRTGFIPHYSTIRRFHKLKSLCFELGISYIDPTLPVENVLSEIQKCDHLICEAMHGAIVADAFRIPWTRITLEVPFYETESINEFKWNDWMLSVGCVSEAFRLERPPLYNRRINKLARCYSSGKWIKHTTKALLRVVNKSHAHLSSDTTHKSVINRISECVGTLRETLERNIPSA